MSLDMECSKHDWIWATEDEYGCPVCHGITLAIQELETSDSACKDWAIATVSKALE